MFFIGLIATFSAAKRARLMGADPAFAGAAQVVAFLVLLAFVASLTCAVGAEVVTAER